MSADSKSGESPPTKRTKYDYFDTVTVLVGALQTEYVVHESIICADSEFFKRACLGNWEETTQKLVTLPEVDPHIFGVFVGWLYTSILDFSQDYNDFPAPKYEPSLEPPAFVQAMHSIMDSFVMGDMLQSQRFCNILVDEFMRFIEGCRKYLRHLTVTILIEKLPAPSTMRRLVVDYVAYVLPTDKFMEDVVQYPADFVIDLAKAGVMHEALTRIQKMPSARPKCFYHDHKDPEKPCA